MNVKNMESAANDVRIFLDLIDAFAIAATLFPQIIVHAKQKVSDVAFLLCLKTLVS